MNKTICIPLTKFHIVTDSRDPICLAEKVSSIVNIVLAMIIFTLNVVVMNRFVSRKRIQKNIGNMLLMQQAVVDSINACYALINSAESVSPCVVHFVDTMSKLRLRYVSIFLFNCSAFASILTLGLISLERLLSVWKPVLHRNKVKKEFIMHLLALLWTVSLFISIMYIAISITARNGKLSCEQYIIFDEFYYWMYCIFAISIAPIFIGTFILAWNIVKRLETRKSDSDLQKKTKKDFKLIKIFSSMYVGFLLSILPIMCVRFMHGLPPKTAASAHHIWRVIVTLTSILNPLLTLNLRKDFRRKTLHSNVSYELESRASSMQNKSNSSKVLGNAHE